MTLIIHTIDTCLGNFTSAQVLPLSKVRKEEARITKRLQTLRISLIFQDATASQGHKGRVDLYVSQGCGTKYQ